MCSSRGEGGLFLLKGERWVLQGGDKVKKFLHARSTRENPSNSVFTCIRKKPSVGFFFLATVIWL